MDMLYLENKYFLIALTFVVYLCAQLLQRRTGLAFLNPILLTIVVLIVVLLGAGIDYETYEEGGSYIDFWLKPAVVALGVPLYRQLESIKKQLLPILVAELAGCIAGIVSVVVVAELFGASRDVIVSLAPKSVTTPIAMEVAQTMNGIPALTAAVVVCTGIFGGMTGFKIVSLARVKSPIAAGLSMGTAAHAVGTSAAIERSDRYGAFSSLGLTLNGLLTSALAPFILRLMGYSF